MGQLPQAESQWDDGVDAECLDMRRPCPGACLMYLTTCKDVSQTLAVGSRIN